MQITDIVIFVAEDRDSTLDYLKKHLTNVIIPKFETKFGIKCSARFHSTTDFGNELEGRRDKCYISVGILDLHDLNKKKGREDIFTIPNTALTCTEKRLIPFCNGHDFRAVILTNVINYCNTEIDDPKTKDCVRDKLEHMRDKLQELIETKMKSFIVYKREVERRGEGKVSDPEVLTNLEDRLFQLIEGEIENSK